jgi:DNA-binding CsgD family transcriptional regulator
LSWTAPNRDELIMRTAVEVHPTRYFQDILRIVDCIYAAACGEMAWEQTLAEIYRVGRLDGCALSMIGTLERSRVVTASYGLGSAAEPEAMLGPIPANPQLTDGVLRSTPGAIWQDRQGMSDALGTTTFRRAECTPNRSVSWACVVVGRDARHVVCLDVYASAGSASSGPELDDLLRRLAPHLTRAWRLGRTSPPPLAIPAGDVSSAVTHANDAADRDLAGLPGVSRLRAEFGLTKAEARLALRLAEGSSLASAAQAFNVKLTTIRSQLQQVFAKTGTSRQTELVAMILSRGYGARGPLWSPVRRERRAATLAEPGS